MRPILVFLSLLCTSAAAASEAADPGAGNSVCSAEMQARIDFLEARLDERRNYANNWWRLWTATYGIGVVFQSVRAGLEDDDGQQADLVVSAAKAVFGTAQLWYGPPLARVGADPMRAVSVDDEAACVQRLSVGEGLLKENAAEARSRWDWKRHFGNVAINVIGAVIVTEGFDENEGWTSAATGIAVGTLQILSFPWKADDDLQEYEERFAPATATAPTWGFTLGNVQGPGVGVQVRF